MREINKSAYTHTYISSVKLTPGFTDIYCSYVNMYRMCICSERERGRGEVKAEEMGGTTHVNVLVL